MANKLKVVVDTNILVSALLRSKDCLAITAGFEKGLFIGVLSPPILEEIRRTLTDEELGIPLEDTNRLLKAIHPHLELVDPKFKIQIC